MRFSRLHRRLLTWLTLLSLGLGTLAPTVAQAAWRAGDRAAWVQVCSSTGMFWVRAGEAADDPAESPQAGGMVACPWCDLHGGASAPPPAGLGSLIDSPAAAVAHTWITGSARAPGWLAPPSRAPPAGT